MGNKHGTSKPGADREDEEDIIIMSDIEDITKLFKQENLIIWHDPNKISPENEQYANHLRSVCDLRVFSDWQETVAFISSSQSHYDVITSGTNGEILVQNIIDKPNVASISVFCGNTSFHKPWAKKYPKVILVDNNFKNVVAKLKDKVTQWQRHSSSLRVSFPAFAPIFDDIDKSQNNSLNFTLRGLVNFKNRYQSKADFLRLSRAIFQDKHNMDRFEKEYKNYNLKTILNWYTKESFLYKITNNCLRIATSDSIQYCRLILKDLETAIKEHYQNKSKEYCGLLYRGTYISNEEWKKLEQNIGKDIEMYGFLSTTKDKTVAYTFARGDTDKKAILTIIVPKAPDDKGQGFAEVSEFSDFQKEEEVLFNVRSRFTILETGIEEIEQKKVRHLVLLYGGRIIGKHLRVKNPSIELVVPNTSELKCYTCDKKVVNPGTTIFYAKISESREYICISCVGKFLAGPDKSPLAVLRNQDSPTTIKIECYITTATQAHIPFYGYRCTGCDNTKISHYYRCQCCQDKKKTWCDRCFNPNNDCISQSHIIVLETCPYTFWSEKLSEHDLNHLNHQEKSLSQAKTFLNTHNYEKAKVYYEKFLLVNQGKDNEEVAAAYSDLGFVYRSLGQAEKALECYTDALKIIKIKQGEESLGAAALYNDIGLTYQKLAQFDKCLDFHLMALNITTKLSGENNLTIAVYCNNLGELYKHLSQYEKSMEYHLKSLEIRKIILGENHPGVTTSYSNVGTLYGILGQYPKAMECHLKAFDIRKAVFGLKHPLTAASYDKIGSVHEALFQYDLALEFNSKSLEIKLSLYGDAHPSVATSYDSIGVIYNSMKQHEKALEYHIKALEVRKLVHEENHPKIGGAYLNLGCTYIDLKNYDKAMECLLQCLEIYKSAYGEKHSDIANCYHKLGILHEKLYESKKAMKYALNSLEMNNAVYGDQPHPNSACSLDLMGNVALQMGKYTEALEYHSKALDMRKSIFEERNITTVTSYHNMAKAYKNLKQFEDAVRCYSFALDITKHICGENHEDTIQLSQSLQAVEKILENKNSNTKKK